jgi:AraC family transcriptional regulator of adaptative response/methylated-DNA-[protein]-cysteine methyltransferase
VRRWFKRVYGMTFLAYGRSKRIASALDSIRAGARVTASAFEYGFESTSGFSDAVRRDTGRPPRHADVDRVVTVTRFSTPLGVMFAAATDDMVCLLEFADRPMLETQLQRMRARIGCRYLPGTNVVLQRLEKELSAYFDGELSTFTIPLLKTGTPFQMKVWDRLCEIPFGSTTSYAVLAKDIGRPSAVRAVAKANGDNRIAILIPCHRVIGSDGRLTGYGGGLWRKHRLLEIETGFRDDHALPENAPSLVQHHPMGNRGTVHAEDAVVDTGR